MSEDEETKARAQAREFPETMEIMRRIRAAMAERLFTTKVSERDIREDLYLRVQTFDAMMNEMGATLANLSSEEAIKEYVKQLATTGE